MRATAAHVETRERVARCSSDQDDQGELLKTLVVGIGGHYGGGEQNGKTGKEQRRRRAVMGLHVEKMTGKEGDCSQFAHALPGSPKEGPAMDHAQTVRPCAKENAQPTSTEISTARWTSRAATW